MVGMPGMSCLSGLAGMTTSSARCVDESTNVMDEGGADDLNPDDLNLDTHDREGGQEAKGSKT